MGISLTHLRYYLICMGIIRMNQSKYKKDKFYEYNQFQNSVLYI